MGIRNCGELGKNLQKMVTRLLANDDLVKLLYYENQDPLSCAALTPKQKQELIYEKLIKITPRSVESDTNKSIVAIYINRGSKLGENAEFRLIEFTVDIVVPLEAWIIKDDNLRPFAILGQVQESLAGKTINGLGKISGGDFDLTNLTTKLSVYSQTFTIVEYD